LAAASSTNTVGAVELDAAQPRTVGDGSIYEVVREGAVGAGRITRHVRPYVQDFKTFAKGRWIGREVLEVVCREFGAHPPSYWRSALRGGHVRVNGDKVAPEYRFRNSDSLLHRTHRHEPPVFGEVTLVEDTADVLAVCKPPSLPMHPCGAYRHNSLEFLMRAEPLCRPAAGATPPPLHVVHRLDRVTSGLVVMAKSKAAAAELSRQIRDKATMKVYLARVKGRFPGSPKDVSYLRALGAIDLGEFNDEAEEHQYQPAVNSSGKRPAAGADGASGGGKRNKNSKKNNTYGRGDDINVEDLPPRVRPLLSREEVGRADNVGVLFAGGSSLGFTRYSLEGVVQVADRAEGAGGESRDGAGVGAAESQAQSEVWVRCPVGVIDQRDGVYACDPCGKPCLSVFRSLGYCAASDTSLVECRPYTGRTHQLRLHLQLLGCPIGNDPCYGGQLFYGEEARRQAAVEALREMQVRGFTPMSKVPHLLVADVDQEKGGQGRGQGQEEQGQEEQGSVAVEHTHAAAADADVDEVDPLPGESEEDFLVRTCRYCRQRGRAEELEMLLHCDGIWLHALRYSSKGTGGSSGLERGWSFQAPHPDWALPFQ